jgi:hypothetical protein
MSLALRDVVAALCVIGVSTFFVPNARAQTEVEQRQVPCFAWWLYGLPYAGIFLWQARNASPSGWLGGRI